ncbi:MAG: hypothetical protein HGA39_04070 [Coriobacteriia bacterium]|nr:hypothetical protein [Coriobacteriia bacterium]
MSPELVGALIAIGTFSLSALTGFGAYKLGKQKDRREQVSTQIDLTKADDVVRDRIVELVEKESEKRVAVVKTEMELTLKTMQLKHLEEVGDLRRSFERQISEVRDELDEYRCYNAPKCLTRRKKASDPIKPETTD